MVNPSCAIEEITPEIAKQWLDVNHRNRKLNEPTIRRLANAIRRGEWMPDCTDGIGLDTDNGVINGQHRLNAIIEADTPVQALVVRNVRPEVIKVIDMGLHRNFGQILQMDGRYPTPQTLAAAVDWIYRITHGFEQSLPTEAKPTVPQEIEVFEAHPGLVGSLDAGLAVWSKTRVQRPMLVAFHYTMASVDPDLADDFFGRLANGLDHEGDTPVHILREKYLAELTKPDSKRERIYVLAAWLVKAWEATRNGEMMTRSTLRWVHTGSRAQAFPKVSDVPWLPQEAEELVA
jgi:hypothetical protein